MAATATLRSSSQALGEALTEVDRARGHRQRRHLGKDRRANGARLRKLAATGRQHGHDRYFARSCSWPTIYEHRALVMGGGKAPREVPGTKP